MQRFEDWLFESEPGWLGEILRSPFSALSIPYLALVKLRTLAYHHKILPSHKALIPVISIGNLSLGGTGKTPLTIWLAEKLMTKGIMPAISIRGYLSKAEKKLLILNKNSRENLNPKLIGDEACLLAQKLKNVPVIVGKNRVVASKIAKDLCSQVLILDDGFQHLKLKRNLDILLLDATKSLFKEKIFPRGRLREPISAIKRANIIIISRASELNEKIISEIKSLNQDCPIFKMRYKVVDSEILFSRKAYAFAGIADPEQFFNMLTSIGIQLIGKRAFSDHHYYQESELRELEKDAIIKGAEMLLTTEKDFMRIKNFKMSIPVHPVRIEPEFFAEEEKLLITVIDALKERDD